MFMNCVSLDIHNFFRPVSSHRKIDTEYTLNIPLQNIFRPISGSRYIDKKYIELHYTVRPGRA